MAKRFITKRDALVMFQDIKESIREGHPCDRIMLAEAWSNFTDSLCKDGIISEYQYNNWTNPF